MAFDVRVITPEDVYFEGRATSMIAPGFEGYLGVLSNHAPLVTPLVEGVVTLRQEHGPEKTFRIDGGFLEVSKNRALILTEKITEQVQGE